VSIAYGDLSITEVGAWLSDFLAQGRDFALPQSIFTELIEETQKIKLKASFSYGAKIRVSFTSSNGEERIVYVNRVAPLEIAFEKYCSERGIDPEAYYFLFKGIELPRNMSASQFGLRNGSTVSVHPLEDRTSTEPLSITVFNIDGSSSVFNVTRGKKLSSFIKSYCELSALNPEQFRFAYNNDVVFEDLTFAEHGMKNGDQLYAHMKPYAPPADYMYRMLNPPEVPPPMVPDPYEMHMASQNMMLLYGQQPGPQLPPVAFSTAPYVPPFPMPPPPQPKSVHHPGKPHDQNPPPSIWESFDMP
jgi:hypothetical protein